MSWTYTVANCATPSTWRRTRPRSRASRSPFLTATAAPLTSRSHRHHHRHQRRSDDQVVGDRRDRGGHRSRLTPAGDLSDSGTIAFTDVDLTDVHASVTPNAGTPLGTPLTLTASSTATTTGSRAAVVSWTYRSRHRDVEYLAEDQTKVETFTITLDDNGGTVDRTATVTITGTNDDPPIGGGDRCHRRGDRAG